MEQPRVTSAAVIDLRDQQLVGGYRNGHCSHRSIDETEGPVGDRQASLRVAPVAGRAEQVERYRAQPDVGAIEFARNVCGLAHANSTEFAPTCQEPVIDILPEQKKIEGLGGNMRLGGKDVEIRPDTVASRLFVEPQPATTANIKPILAACCSTLFTMHSSVSPMLSSVGRRV